MSRLQQYCTFWLAADLFGVAIEAVQEIVRFQPMAPVPHAAPAVAGLVNLRGDIVAAIDLRRCLAYPGLPDGAQPTNVVVRAADGLVSLLVDEIGDVVEIDEARAESPPEHVRGPARALIHRIVNLKQGVLMVLAVERVIERATEVPEDERDPRPVGRAS